MDGDVNGSYLILIDWPADYKNKYFSFVYDVHI